MLSPSLLQDPSIPVHTWHDPTRSSRGALSQGWDWRRWWSFTCQAQGWGSANDRCPPRSPSTRRNHPAAVLAANGSHLPLSSEKLPHLAGHPASHARLQPVASEWLTGGTKGSPLAPRQDQLWDVAVLWSSLWDLLIPAETTPPLSFHPQTILLHFASLPLEFTCPGIWPCQPETDNVHPVQGGLCLLTH